MIKSILIINKDGYHLKFTTTNKNGRLCCLEYPLIYERTIDVYENLKLAYSDKYEYSLKAREFYKNKIADLLGVDNINFQIKIEDDVLTAW